MSRRVAVLVLVAGVVTSGCVAQGDPDGTGPVFPPRPVEVRTAGLDPCSMLTRDQQRELGARSPTARDVPVNGHPSPTCVWLTATDLGYGTQIVPIGADVAATEPGAVVVDVHGFGAVRGTVREMTGGAPTCQLTVDAAPGRSIRVQVQATGERPRTDEEMCRIATDVTGMVMTTVAGAVR